MKGNFSMKIDATNVFDQSPSQTQNVWGVVQEPSMISIQGFEMNQSLELPLSNKDTLTLVGVLETQDRHGGGSVEATLRRILASNTYLDFKGTLGAKNEFSVSAFKRISQKCNGSIQGLLRYKNGSVAPFAIGTIGYNLNPNLTGQIRYKTGTNLLNSSMQSSLIFNRANLSGALTLNLNVKNTYLMLSLTRKFMEDTLKLSSSFRFGYLGLMFTYGIEKQVTQFSRVDATMIINNTLGVVLKLGLERGQQTFVVPIHLSHEVLPSAIFYGTVTPMIFYYVVKRLIIDPYLKEKEESDAKEKQERLKLEINERRRLALAAQNLMKESVNRVIEKEGENGLVIKKAVYGKIVDKNNINYNSEKLIDVTIPLQFLVKDHSLHVVTDQTKSNIEGFYDPCIGEQKTLYVEYRFKGEEYKGTFNDTEIIRLPKLTHKVQWWSRPFSAVR